MYGMRRMLCLEVPMAISIVCQTEGWVVRKGPLCDKCYWYEPGTEKEVDGEPPIGCEDGKPVHRLDSADQSDR
jgi:hypothetical protein